jgi:hypothetical protein
VKDALLVASGAKAVKDMAQRLGLTWSLRPCTIFSFNENQVKVTLDGDDAVASVPVVSLVGTPALGARYMALIIPDCIFIAAAITGTVAREMTNNAYHINNTDQTVTNVSTLLGDCDVAVNAVGNARWEVTAVFDVQTTVLGTTIFVGELLLDGVSQLGQALMQVIAAPDRRTVSQIWQGTFATGGQHHFQLFVSKTANVATVVARANFTRYWVKTYE